MAEAGSFAWMALSAAGRGVGRNKLRSALTMLGIFIGVAALIAMLAVGEGASAALKKQLESLGTNLLVVLPGTTRANGVRAGIGSASTLRVTDGAAILEEDSAVADISYVNRQGAQVVNGNQNWSTSVQGVTPSYLSIRDWPVVAGRKLEREGRGRRAHGLPPRPDGAREPLRGVPESDRLDHPRQERRHGGRRRPRHQGTFGVRARTRTTRCSSRSAPRRSASSASRRRARPRPSRPSSSRRPNPFGIQPKLTGFVHTMYVQARSPELVKTALQQVTRRSRSATASSPASPTTSPCAT